MTCGHQLWQVVRFDIICNPLSWSLAENFRSVLQILFRCDQSTSIVTSHSIRHYLQPPFVVTRGNFPKCLVNPFPVWRMDINCDESFDSSRIESIRHYLQPPFVIPRGMFSKCLANRLPVWRVDIDCDESFDSSRIESIRQYLRSPFVATGGKFTKCLANRLPVWRKSRDPKIRDPKMRDPKIGDSWNKLSPSCVTAVSFSSWNRLHLSASKWEHMTLVVKPLRLNRAQEKRRTTSKLIIVMMKN